MNPEHTVPTLDDNGFVIWDSHAICTYLIDKYAKNDSLYPKDLQLRAKCNQRMFFDASSLFVRLRDCSVHVIYKKAKDIPQNMIDPIYSAYEILEKFLSTEPFLVGKFLTIADISTSLTIFSLQVYAPLESDKHSKIMAWIDRVKQTIPFFDADNSKYTDQYRQLVHITLQKNNQNWFCEKIP